MLSWREGTQVTDNAREDRVAPRADLDGFTDSTGKHMDWAAGIREAAYCIQRQGETRFIEELLEQSASPADILVWLVYPDTGEFAT